MLKLSRRLLIQMAGLVVASPALAAPSPRAPYLEPGEIVQDLFFHQWDRPGAPVGPLLVHEIKPWDGRGYPVILRSMRSWGGDKEDYYDAWYDHDWFNHLRHVPARFWHDPAKCERYPNIHAYVREQRFGEHPDVMRKTMERNWLSSDTSPRPRVAPRWST